MRRRPKPQEGPPPLTAQDVYNVRRILEQANAARERGENMHHHPLLERLAEVTRKPLAYYVFAFCPDDRELSAAELAELAAGLCRQGGERP